LFPMLTAERQHLVLYFSTEYNNSRQNILILLWTYLVDIRSEAWLNSFWNYKNGKLLAAPPTSFSKITGESYKIDIFLKTWVLSVCMHCCFLTV
jgi:hypothetical protein